MITFDHSMELYRIMSSSDFVNMDIIFVCLLMLFVLSFSKFLLFCVWYLIRQRKWRNEIVQVKFLYHFFDLWFLLSWAYTGILIKWDGVEIFVFLSCGSIRLLFRCSSLMVHFNLLKIVIYVLLCKCFFDSFSLC